MTVEFEAWLIRDVKDKGLRAELLRKKIDEAGRAWCDVETVDEENE